MIEIFLSQKGRNILKAIHKRGNEIFLGKFPTKKRRG
jgi:hypothetical protein